MAKLLIVSAYHVCDQKFDTAANTVSAQQTHLMQAQSIPTPNPCKTFLTNLIHQIQQWHAHNKEIILCMDANNHTDDPKASISHLCTESDLIDLHHQQYPSL